MPLSDVNRGQGRPGRLAGATAGLVAAAAALGLGELVAGLVTGWPSPVVAVAEAAIDLAPGSVDALVAAVEGGPPEGPRFGWSVTLGERTTRSFACGHQDREHLLARGQTSPQVLGQWAADIPVRRPRKREAAQPTTTVPFMPAWTVQW